MAGRFRISPTPGGGQHDPWFRIGTLDVTTTMFVTLAAVVVMVSHVFSVAIPDALVLYPDLVVRGQLWRLVTWPLANYIHFWTVVTIFFFWYFGSQLEQDLGRSRMARFLVWTTLLLGLLAVALSSLRSFASPQLDSLERIELVVLLVWIAERPHARFLFNVPAWLLGVVLVAIPVLGMLAARPPMLLDLLHFLLGLAIAALVAKHYGLLAAYDAVPRLGGGGARRPKPPRRGRAPRGSGGVVTGPWAGSSAPQPVDSDRAKLDALLDKIHESGMDSLSASERKQLDVLRRRIRGE